jgi:hypothetical protein
MRVCEACLVYEHDFALLPLALRDLSPVLCGLIPYHVYQEGLSGGSCAIIIAAYQLLSDEPLPPLLENSVMSEDRET